MIKRNAFYALVKAASGLDPYPDFIPQEAALPAMSYSLVSTPPGERTLEGGITLQGHYWQLEVLAATRLELDEIGLRVQALDGQRTDDFQLVTVSEPRDSPYSPESSSRQSIIEIQTTNRRNQP